MVDDLRTELSFSSARRCLEAYRLTRKPATSGVKSTLVYPEFFRRRTPELGRYLGVYQQGRLVAMAGERMRLDGYQEISAICTHPEFTGRGYAARLTTELVNASLQRGSIPFLHVGSHNTRARALYERLGFRERIDVGLWSVQRR